MPEPENDVDRVAELIAWHSAGRPVDQAPDADPQLMAVAEPATAQPGPTDLRSA
jgi:hypothetical protein